MANKYNSLEELRRKKALLKKEVSDLQDLLTFEDTKESLSVLTHGFSDSFLKEEYNKDGEKSVALDGKEIVKSISNQVKSTLMNKKNIMNFAKSDVGSSIAENAIKLSIVGFVGNYAKKSLSNSNWKKKVLGLILIYLAPSLLRYLRTKLEDYEKNRSVSSMEQLI
ncbi:hypothetical protein SAMN05421847_3009 [Halpernia humi]|uniref:Phosphoribosyl-ATP pyrophosphatase n=1 Tax=Halpernia humi TaxID=493375 RepID=A0A1H6BMV7_9FLAO|nr:phosphoribosyl-ATP pyrophosphatase [Halpernia humi]SEG61972.1 hypothetical protein SAMN05421847_3009 [Halpernia humi]